MTGRASLIVILGFSLIIGTATRYWTYASGKAVQNAVNYYGSSRSHNDAVIAANLACDSIFQNNADTATISGLKGTFSDGSHYAINAVMQQGYGKFRNCFITATGTDTDIYHNVYDDTVQVLLSPYSFSRFAWFTSSENGVDWVTGDTLTGPLQTDGKLYINGDPVVNGPVSIGQTLVKTHTTDSLICNSFRSGVTDSLPNTFDTTYTIGDTTKVFSNPKHTGSNYAYDVYLTFDTLGANGTGRVIETDTTRYWNGSNWIDSGHTAPQTIKLDSIVNPKTGENLILVKDGDAHVSGIVHGDVTVVANQPASNYRKSSSTQKVQNGDTQYFNSSYDGNILITGSLLYRSNPNNGGNDVLGLVATNSIGLATQKYTSPGNSSVTIDAALFALKGSFTYMDYDGKTNSNDYMGYIYLNGSMTQSSRGAVGQVNNFAGPGYLKNYRYDTRYRYLAPPGFPLSHHYVVLSWRE